MYTLQLTRDMPNRFTANLDFSGYLSFLAESECTTYIIGFLQWQKGCNKV